MASIEETVYFLDARSAHSFASRKAGAGVEANIYENVGGSQFVFLATYHANPLPKANKVLEHARARSSTGPAVVYRKHQQA